MKEAFCAFCGNIFYSDSSKQIYCGTECRQKASKEKIITRYNLEKVRKRIGKDRRCAGGCGTILSVYNDSKMCENCIVNNKKMNRFLKEIRYYFDYEQG